MAKDSPISYLPGNDPETVKANLDYQTALANLNSSLDARKNRLFDPALASFAAAMLEPGHGGGFGEALGRSVRAYSAGEEADIKNQQEIEAKRVELARMGMELQSQRAGSTLAQNIIAKKLGFPTNAAPTKESPEATSPTSPLAAAAGAGASAAPLSNAAPTGVAPIPTGIAQKPQISPRTFQIGKPNPLAFSPEEAFAIHLSMHPNDFDGAREAARKANDDIKVQQNYTFNSNTGEYTLAPSATTAKFYFNNGTYEIDPADAIRLDSLRTSKDPSFAAEARRVIADRPSLEDIEFAKQKKQIGLEAEKAGAVTGSTKRAERIEKQTEDLFSRAESSRETMSMTKQVRQMVENPDISPIFGMFTTNKLLDNAVVMIDKGVMGIRMSGLEDAMRNARLTDDQIVYLRLAAQYFNDLQLKMAALLKGSVSDFEQNILAKSVMNIGDPAKTISMKNDILELRSLVEVKIADAFEKSGIQDPQKFKRSQAYKNIIKEYDQQLRRVIGGEKISQNGDFGDTTSSSPGVGSAAKPAAPSGKNISIEDQRENLRKQWGK
jgi:hypothetical protein